MYGFALIFWLALGFIIQGCSTYEPKVVPMKLPEAHANVQRVEGAHVAARVWPMKRKPGRPSASTSSRRASCRCR